MVEIVAMVWIWWNMLKEYFDILGNVLIRFLAEYKVKSQNQLSYLYVKCKTTASTHFVRHKDWKQVGWPCPVITNSLWKNSNLPFHGVFLCD